MDTANEFKERMQGARLTVLVDLSMGGGERCTE